MTLRKLSCVAAIVSGIALPALAEAQSTGYLTPAANTQRLLSDPPGIDEGLPWGLYGSIGIAAYYETNIQRVQSGGDDDVKIVIPAALTYRQRFGRHQGHLRLSTDIGRYTSLTSENYENWTLDGAILFDLTRKVYADLHAAYTEAYEERGAPGTPVIQFDERNKVAITSYGGTVGYGRNNSRLDAAVGVNRNEWRYKNNGQEIRDRDEDEVFVRAGYDIGAKTNVFGEIQHSDIEYLRSLINRDGTRTTYWIGVGYQPGAVTYGEVKVGRTERKYDNPAFEDSKNTVFAGRVNWQPRERHRFNAYATRTVEEGTGLASEFVSKFFGLRWDYLFARDWNFFAYGNYGEDDYTTGRQDEFTEYGVGLSKALFRWLSVDAGYARIERTSNVPGLDYDADIVRFGLRAQAGTNLSKKLAGPGVE